MAHIFPIQITRPLRNKVCIFPEKETCNLTTSDINAVLRRNPYSYYNIFFKPYIKRLQGDKKFNAIKRQFNKFKRKKIIEIDENAGFYIYNIIDSNGNESTGIIGKMPFSDLKTKLVKQVECVPENLKNHKKELFSKTGFMSRPVNVVHENNLEIEQLIQRYKSKIPLFEFTKNSGFIHEVWQILDPDDIEFLQDVFKNMNSFLLIDNKGEFEGIYQVYLENIKRKHHSGNEAYNYFPAFLIARNQTKIHEYKKGIPTESVIETDELIKALKNDFYFEPISSDEVIKKADIFLYTLTKKYRLTLKKGANPDLPDIFIFDKYILPILKNLDPEMIPGALKYCSGNRSLKCVENQLNKGNCKFGFILHQTNYDQIDNLVKRGINISTNSVYLEPRILKGLFIYEF